MMESLTHSTLHQWPKADLHCHLDGSLRLSTLFALAEEQGKSGLLPAQSEEELGFILTEVDRSGTLEAYLDWFRYSIAVMQSPTSLHRIAYELVQDNADENVRYLEVRYCPLQHTREGMSLEDVNQCVLGGLREGSRDFGVSVGLIICGLRNRLESESLRLAELAVKFRDNGVVGFDLAGAEAGFPAKQHLPAFYYAANNLMNITIHAGEAWGPESIHQALFRCHAHRIGHGTTLIQDDALLKYVVDHRIPLEICPTSNVQTAVVSSYGDHPLSRYVESEVAVTINTDNRLFSRTTVTDELWRVHTECGVPAAAIREIVLNGFRHAFLSWDERKELLSQVQEEFRNLDASQVNE